MMVNLSTHKGTIDQADPGFAYSQRPFPGGTTRARRSRSSTWAPARP